jgi:hypothetical protein
MKTVMLLSVFLCRLGGSLMGKKTRFLSCFLFLFAGLFLQAQSNISVPLENEVYYLLEQAQLKGLSLPLPSAKPYSRQQILKAIDAIFDADEEGIFGEKKAGLSPLERDILEQARKSFEKGKKGLDMTQGVYTFESNRFPRAPFTGNVGLGTQVAFSSGFFQQDREAVWGTDNFFSFYTNGDIGSRFSYHFNFIGFLSKAERREYENSYYTYYEGAVVNAERGYFNKTINTYSQPLAYFPYTYTRRYDGWVIYPAEISAEGMQPWPEQFAIAPHFNMELSGGFFDNMLTWRFGRLRREWGGMSEGRSLVFNGSAMPFMALEASFTPVHWFSFSAITGSLEYYDYYGDLKLSSWDQQNNFTMEILELNYKNRFHFDLGTAAVWPKRLELGYIFPLKSTFFAQDTLGDFDNMGFFFDVMGQYPGFGKFWLSFFADDIDPNPKNIPQFAILDRQMFALQGGMRLHFPWLPFSSLTFTYTKIEPYTYTHPRLFVPWYSNDFDGQVIPMREAYTNAGDSLGYYLPPNSDEFLIRFDAMPFLNTRSFFQYQMIRHGATHGPHAVDGSSLESELDPLDRTEKEVLEKFFLRDGAYQWQHIFMIGAEHKITAFTVPLRVFAKTGIVYSFYTDIDGQPNSGEEYPYQVVDTGIYPKATEFILTLGVRIFL